MPIDIRNVSSGKVSSGSTSSKKSKISSSEGESSAASDDQDSVQLTGKASQIQSLITQMMSFPIVDQSRVGPVKEKVDEGRYNIEPEQVANKMLDFESSYSRLR